MASAPPDQYARGYQERMRHARSGVLGFDSSRYVSVCGIYSSEHIHADIGSALLPRWHPRQLDFSLRRSWV